VGLHYLTVRQLYNELRLISYSHWVSQTFTPHKMKLNGRWRSSCNSNFLMFPHQVLWKRRGTVSGTQEEPKTRCLWCSSSSSLKITNRSFRYASPCLWNKLPASFRQPNHDHSFSRSSQPNSLSSSVSSSPLSLSITPTLFHSKFKRYLFLNLSLHRPHPFHRTAFTDTGLLNRFLFIFSINLLVWFVQ